MKKYLQFDIQVPEKELMEILIAQLSEEGIDGFEEEEKRLLATGDSADVNEAAIETLLFDAGVDFEKRLINEENWNALWESNFSPVLVDNFVGIRAHFHPPFQNVQHEIVITPKMSFGTGHHATTWQVIKMMEGLPFQGATVFDFGTGTGVLAILAERLGSKLVIASDNDPWSIANAQENFEVNGCKKIRLLHSDNLESVESSDIVLANINKHVLIAFANELKALVLPKGFLLLSGLLLNDEKEIDEAFISDNFEKLKSTHRSGWIALLYRRNVVQ